jgi:hypothetical protein
VNKNLSSKSVFLGLVVSVVLLAVSAVAADKAASPMKGTLQLPQSASIGATELASGKYRVEWTGSGDQVDVKIFRGNNLVASTPARLVKVDPAPYDNAAYVTGQGGAKSVTQMSFAKQKYALRIGSEPANTATQASAK